MRGVHGSNLLAYAYDVSRCALHIDEDECSRVTWLRYTLRRPRPCPLSPPRRLPTKVTARGLVALLHAVPWAPSLHAWSDLEARGEAPAPRAKFHALTLARPPRREQNFTP